MAVTCSGWVESTSVSGPTCGRMAAATAATLLLASTEVGFGSRTQKQHTSTSATTPSFRARARPRAASSSSGPTITAR